MFERCVLHIGTEKTGTTTLQRFLAVNRRRLGSAGYFVPSCFGDRNHRKLSTYAMDDHRIDDGRKALGVQDVEAHRAEVQRAFVAEIEGRNEHTMILTSEHCHSRLLAPSEVQRVRELLEPYCRDFMVIVYLRPQYAMAVSLNSTALRVGYSDRPLFPTESVPVPYYDYEQMLERWDEVFAGSVNPRLYDELLGNDLCEDFLRSAEIHVKGLVSVPRENTSLGATAQMFLSHINRALTRRGIGPHSRTRGNLGALVQGGGDAPMPPRDQVERFMAIYERGNEAVRARWFPQRERLFSLSFGQLGEGSMAELSLEEAFEAFADIWVRKQEQVLREREQLGKANHFGLSEFEG